jgi:hypothetical protein
MLALAFGIGIGHATVKAVVNDKIRIILADYAVIRNFRVSVPAHIIRDIKDLPLGTRIFLPNLPLCSVLSKEILARQGIRAELLSQTEEKSLNGGRRHLGKTLCEDCYMDALSPVRSCDPWSTHSAKSFEKHMADMITLTSIQSEIIHILKDTGGAGEQILLEKLDDRLSPAELGRELSTLRHMEKIGGQRQGDQMIWQLWK